MTILLLGAGPRLAWVRSVLETLCAPADPAPGIKSGVRGRPGVHVSNCWVNCPSLSSASARDRREALPNALPKRYNREQMALNPLPQPEAPR